MVKTPFHKQFVECRKTEGSFFIKPNQELMTRIGPLLGDILICAITNEPCSSRNCPKIKEENEQENNTTA